MEQALSNRLSRGFTLLYRPNEVNHCPACGRQHWLVGRMMAECAFCATALPLQTFSTYGTAPVFSRTPSMAELRARA